MKTKQFIVALTALTAAASPSFAADIVGTTWLRDDGTSKIHFERCQDAVCGSIAWLKPGFDTKAKVGERVVYDMRPDGSESWSGKASKPGEDKTFSGQMTVAGSTLTLSGCLVGGLLCKSVTWTRTP